MQADSVGAPARSVLAPAEIADSAVLFDIPSSVDTPALVVDVSILQDNLADMARLCAESGVELVPHAKTHRSVEIGRLQIQAGAAGLCVAKLGEAEGFAGAGVERIVLAYPLVGSSKVARAAALSTAVDLTVATDSLEGARAIGDVFADRGAVAQTLLIVDTGLHRCGVSAAEATGLALEMAAVPGIRLAGVMTHEGAVYGAIDQDDLVRRATAAAELMVHTAEEIRQSGVPIETVSLGASASARVVRAVPGVTQVRPGIYAFNDLGQVVLGTATLGSCAARVLATVVSRAAPDRACIDAGSKSLSQDGLPASGAGVDIGFGLMLGHPGWRIDRLSEEHGWLRWCGPGAPTPLAIGERVQIVPNHVCTVFSSLREIVAIADGRVTAEWTTLPPGSSR